MRVLVIPDVHHQTDWADKIEALERDKVDLTVYLGDYFDDWNDTVEMSQRTARWLKAKLEQPKTEMLLGNHDLTYAWPNIFICSGWSEEKHLAVNDILTRDDFKKLLPFVRLDKWLLTHAGFGAHLTLTGSLDTALVDYAKAFKRMHDGDAMTWVFDRFLKNEGPLWIRPWDLYPAVGTNQIFGHTIHDQPLVREHQSGKQVGLDTNARHYALLDTVTDEIEIKELSDEARDNVRGAVAVEALSPAA